MAFCSSSDFKAKFKEETIKIPLKVLSLKTTTPSLICSISKNCWVGAFGIIKN